MADDDVVKIHVHTNNPGLAIEKALTFGQLSRMKIDNMREEHNEKLNLEAAKAQADDSASANADAAGSENSDGSSDAGSSSYINAAADNGTENKHVSKPAEPPKDNAFVAISVGKGLDEIFKGLGVDNLIAGGQTMNPSTDDILTAIESINAKNVYVLPNNKNIILAAEQAKELTEDKNVVVIPSKTVPQGIAAMINFLSDKTPEENEEVMKEAMANIKTGSVTYSVRDTKIDGLEIKMGDFMGIDDHSIKSTGSDVIDVSVELIESMLDEDSELISIYYGEDGNEEDAVYQFIEMTALMYLT